MIDESCAISYEQSPSLGGIFDYVGEHVDGCSMEQASIDRRKERKEERCFPVGNSKS